LIVRGSAAALLRNYPCNIAFIDPPYDQVKEYAASLTTLAETQCGLAIAQHASRVVLEESYGALRKARVLRQGENLLSFFERVEDADAARREV
jgi:16S rRNA G966 N2-methylase RsmD